MRRTWRFERPTFQWLYTQDDAQPPLFGETGYRVLGSVRVHGRDSHATVYERGKLPQPLAHEGRLDDAKSAVERWWLGKDP